MKNRYVKLGLITSVAVLVILGVALFFLYPQRNPQLLGTWERIDGNYTRTFHADGSGNIEPEISSIGWRTRGGQLILESMGVERYYVYSVSKSGEELLLVFTDHNGRRHSREYVRVGA